MSQISIKELDEFSIHGNLYEHRDPSNRGIVLGTGILGNRFGLKDAAKTLAEQLHDYVITLDPPSHHRNLKQEFSFGNYAKDEENAASYLRDRYKVECVIGGGHSGGAMAGLFAVTAYSDLEQSLLESNRMPIVPPYRKVFDGLIVAALPADARTAAPGFMYAPFVLKIAQYLFHKDNKTKTENFTKYVKKSKGMCIA